MSSRFYVFKICEKLQLPESSGSSSFWRVSQQRAATNHIVGTSLGSSAARIRQRHHTTLKRAELPALPADHPALQPHTRLGKLSAKKILLKVFSKSL